MRYSVMTGIITASIFLAGCEKKNASPENSSSTNTPVQVETTNASPPPQQPRSDAELFQKAAGVWKYNDTNKIFGIVTENSVILATNGNFVKQTVMISKTSRKNFTGTGTWQVKDGDLVTTISKVSPLPEGPIGNDLRKGLAGGGITSHNRIIDVTDFELVTEIDVIVLSGNGGHTDKKGKRIWTR